MMQQTSTACLTKIITTPWEVEGARS
jgi:hypothetical protein